MSKVGLLVIASNKYVSFLGNLLASADNYFLPDHDVEYFVFTNQREIPANSRRKIHLIDVEHKEWPWMTMGRYKIFADNSDALSQMDYLYYCDADMRFVDVVGSEILSHRVVTQHPGYYGRRGTPEEAQTRSHAYVGPTETMQYFAGGFNGGSRQAYLEMALTLSQNISADYENGIIAVWYDESHLNRYCIDHPPTKILDPGYCYGESLRPPFHPRLLALDKDHQEYCAEVPGFTHPFRQHP